jgi:hypothetical protein
MAESSAARRRTTVTFFLLGLAWPMAARAYRPFNSTDAAVADKGTFEIELSPAGLLKEGAGQWLVAPSVILNWGFADGVELVLEGRNFVALSSDAPQPRLRVDDAALSLKAVLRDGSLQQKSGLSLATELSALLPATSGDGGAGVEAALIVSQRWEAVTAHLNGAASWTRAHTAGVFAGLILEGHDAWPVRPVTEVFVEAEHDVPTTVSWLGGAIWRALDELSLDAALRLARAGGAGTTEVRLGLTWAFSVGFPRVRRPP